ncbi:hypothetical protein [Cellulomonas endophytica]|uniref:hypothetical protein n=1 Tax=Cellulomonas endophytica TaxID=2494735 RepID=UPI001011FDFC|nr:hypothetical protein [Cellulomonas endophytica]
MVDLALPERLLVGTVDGVRVELARAVLTDRGLRLEWDGVEDATTRALDARFERERATWAAALRVGGTAAAGAPPPMPGDRLRRVTAVVVDADGTELTWTAGRAAGDGTAWRSQWRYPRPTGTRVLVRFTVDGEPTATCTLELPRPPAA